MEDFKGIQHYVTTANIITLNSRHYYVGVKVQALTHLQHFAQHYTDIFQHLVLYVPTDPHELTIPVGDVGMLLSDALNDKLAVRLHNF